MTQMNLSMKQKQTHGHREQTVVAKGRGVEGGVDYEETFSPTANLTSIRVLMQKAVQENLILHQMDVKKQPTVALSTCEAEYMALASTTQEVMYLAQLLDGIDRHQYPAPKVYEDNQGAIALAKNPVNRQRCKHVDIFLLRWKISFCIWAASFYQLRGTISSVVCYSSPFTK